jgi:hypothetical protein
VVTQKYVGANEHINIDKKYKLLDLKSEKSSSDIIDPNVS